MSSHPLSPTGSGHPRSSVVTASSPVGITRPMADKQILPGKVPTTRPKPHAVRLKHSWLPRPSTRGLSCRKEASSRSKALECEECAGASSPAQDGDGLRSPRPMGAFSQPSQGHRGATTRHLSALGSGLSLLEVFPGSQAGSAGGCPGLAFDVSAPGVWTGPGRGARCRENSG